MRGCERDLTNYVILFCNPHGQEEPEPGIESVLRRPGESIFKVHNLGNGIHFRVNSMQTRVMSESNPNMVGTDYDNWHF